MTDTNSQCFMNFMNFTDYMNFKDFTSQTSPTPPSKTCGHMMNATRTSTNDTTSQLIKSNLQQMSDVPLQQSDVPLHKPTSTVRCSSSTVTANVRCSTSTIRFNSQMFHSNSKCQMFHSNSYIKFKNPKVCTSSKEHHFLEFLPFIHAQRLQ